MVYWELLPDVQVCQGPARAHRTQHTVHPGHREPIVTEAVERRKEAAISRLLKSPIPNSSKALLLAQQLASYHFWDILDPSGLCGWMSQEMHGLLAPLRE